jgi:hypothetical protein
MSTDLLDDRRFPEVPLIFRQLSDQKSVQRRNLFRQRAGLHKTEIKICDFG